MNITGGTQIAATFSTNGGSPPIPSFAAPTVTPMGTPGATTYNYVVNALQNGITIAQTPVTTITNGNATLSGSNFNQISWLPVLGADHYAVVNTTAGATLTETTALTLNDTGAGYIHAVLCSEAGYAVIPRGLHVGASEYAVGVANALALTSNHALVKVIGNNSLPVTTGYTSAGIDVEIFDSTQVEVAGLRTTLTSSSAGELYGMVAAPYLQNLSGTPMCSAFFGFASAGYNGANGGAADVTCFKALTINGGTGTVAAMSGFQALAPNNNGTITQLNGVLIQDQTNPGGTVTHAYGLHIAEQTQATPGSAHRALKVDSSAASASNSDGAVEFDGPTIFNFTVAPATSSSPGTPGQIAFDAAGHVYICTATNTWVRNATAFTTF